MFEACTGGVYECLRLVAPWTAVRFIIFFGLWLTRLGECYTLIIRTFWIDTHTHVSTHIGIIVHPAICFPNFGSLRAAPQAPHERHTLRTSIEFSVLPGCVSYFFEKDIASGFSFSGQHICTTLYPPSLLSQCLQMPTFIDMRERHLYTYSSCVACRQKAYPGKMDTFGSFDNMYSMRINTENYRIWTQ